MAVNFPNSPINGEQFTANGVTYQWNSTTSLWEISLVTVPTDVNELTDDNALLVGGGGGQGVTAYTNMSDLPMTGNSTGAMAFITSTNGLFIWNGSTWYGVTVQSNTGPSISSVQDGSSGTAPFTLSTLGAATVVTVTATDPEGAPLTYSYSVTSGSLTNGGGTTATVTQNGNVFTVTPTTTTDYAGTFELTFTASDGELSDTSAASFTLQFVTPLQADTQGNTLLLTTSGSAGDNSVFTDSSSNALTITPGGTPSSQSFSPYRAGGYSLQLDGNDYITPGFNDNFGAGDFTFECWVKTTVGGIIMGQYDGGSQMEAFEILTASGIMASHTDSGTEGGVGTKDLRDNQWHHLVWERHSGTYYYYADGELQGTLANTENGSRSSGWYIGRHGTANIGHYTGELRDIKFTVGTAVYGGTTPSVPIESTIDGTETFVFATGLPYGKDLSTNGDSRTITYFGDPKFVPEGPYDVEIYDTTKHGGSIYFDGVDDYLTVPSDPAFAFGTGDFTVEGWVYRSSTPTYSHFVDFRGANNNGSNPVFYWYNNLIHYTDDNSTGENQIQTSNAIGANAWNHLAIVRSNGTLTVYVNGVDSGSVSYTTDILGGNTVYIGNRFNNLLLHSGYISDLRITSSAVYTSNFTPPTEPQSSVGAALHVVGTDANIYDATQTVKPVTLVGNADSSTTRAKYTTSSIYMDGTGYVELPAGSINISGSQDYTIEGWINFNSIGGDQGIFQVNWPSNNLELIVAYWQGWATYINGSLNIDTSVTPTTNQWYHVAVSRESGTVRVFLDGSTIRTVTGDTTAMENMTLVIGGYVSTSYLSDAYFEDWRITTGLARYTDDFTVPTESLLTYTPPPAAAGASSFTFTGGDWAGTSTNSFTYSSNVIRNTSGASYSDGIQNGKVYFEVDLTSISNVAMGLYPSSLTDFGFTTAGGATIDSTTGDVYPGPIDENATITNSSVLMFAADATAQKVWIGVDGTWTTATGDPATGSGISTSGASGETYVFAAMSTTGGAFTGTAEATILTSGGLNYTVPTGFSALADVSTAASYGDRGIIMGGLVSDNNSVQNRIQYFDITATGNASDFGDLNTATQGSGNVSNATLGLTGGGYDGSSGISSVDYITIATTGNATSAGNLTYARYNLGAFSNGIRGVFCGGYTTENDNTVDYVTIATSVTAADFGDSLVAMRLYGTASDNTYGIQAGGYAATYVNTIQYYTIATTGNATDFGNLTSNYYDKQGVYDLTYSVFAGGSPYTATIDYITTATTGDASDFGDLLVGNRNWSGSGCSNGTRGVFCGGGDTSGTNVMQYITISTPSNATDFGDMLTPATGLWHPGCTSGNAS